MFKKVLIANRGEIAVKIINSLKKMGVKTVAIYSTIDRNSLHVRLADESVCVGGPRPKESYLNIKNILEAALGTGAQAIHPGYGFLSENAKFAKMCAKYGLVFIGPSDKSIEKMGDKQHARQIMRAHNIPIIPGSTNFIHSVDEAQKIAIKIGCPVLLKATAGGGGKGIRQVNRPEEMEAALVATSNEAKESFGNDRIYMEKVMQNVKHIEIQVFRDKFGQTVYFPERDCSLQINKQKVLEESPCDLITEKERKYLGHLAIQIAKKIKYINTGTIEFLMDQKHNFYFLEMNTRIQVEHSITEKVTGLDLIKAQILVAARERLPFKQSDIKILGHAIECRINAQDPTCHFLPSAGRIKRLYFPPITSEIKIDSALYQGEQISPFYDSMLAKIIAFGDNRKKSIVNMKRLLCEIILDGISTTQSLDLAILDSTTFIKGTFNNTYLENKFLSEIFKYNLLKNKRRQNTFSKEHSKDIEEKDSKLIEKCHYCGQEIFFDQFDEYKTCPACDYGFRISAKQRIKLIVDDFKEWDATLESSDPFKFPDYSKKIVNAKNVSGLNEAILSGKARIANKNFALGIMDPTFIMGTIGQMTGEKLALLFENATKQKLPVVLFTASGGARIQEGILSLMQLAKISNAVAAHSNAGLLYIVVLTDPTTAGVTASFASQADIILAEPHALVGFAGRKVIEQTINQHLPKDQQLAENVLKHGFIDHIVKRSDEKEILSWLLQFGGKKYD